MNNLIIYLPLFLQGIGTTIAAWLCAISISLIIGTTIGIFSCRYLTSSYVLNIVRIYTFVFKGIPAYVQILIAYFVIPSLLGINMSGFTAATCALALCSSAYVTEIVRSGINVISYGQWDACKALGYPLKKTLRRIILPQTFFKIFPTLMGEIQQVLQSTSLFATIGVTEITRVGTNIISRELNPLPIYLLIACVYLVFSALLQSIIIMVERRKMYGCR